MGWYKQRPTFTRKLSLQYWPHWIDGKDFFLASSVWILFIKVWPDFRAEEYQTL